MKRLIILFFLAAIAVLAVSIFVTPRASATQTEGCEKECGWVWTTEEKCFHVHNKWVCVNVPKKEWKCEYRCEEPTSTPTATPSGSGEPTSTPEVTSTPEPHQACGKGCVVDDDCRRYDKNYICYKDNTCRVENNSEDPQCNPRDPQPTSTPISVVTVEQLKKLPSGNK